jgi:hypothetical protein
MPYRELLTRRYCWYSVLVMAIRASGADLFGADQKVMDVWTF